MSYSRGISGKIARSYCERHKDLPTLTLAKLMFGAEENKGIWTQLEQARSAIRLYRGEMGNQMRKVVKDKIETTKEKRLAIPSSYAKEAMPYILAIPGRGTIAGDIHVPYHDAKAVELWLEWCDRNGATDFCILNGDIVDFYSLSSFEKDPRQRRWAEELDALRQFLRLCAQVFGEVIFRVGNHERRYWRYMVRAAPALVGEDALEFEKLLKLADYGIAFVDHGRAIHLGKLSVFHGHEFYGSGGVYPARWLYLKTKTNAVCGHFHRGSVYTTRDARGKVITCWTHGTLGELSPAFSPFNEWDQSFLDVEFDGKRMFDVSLKRIVEGKVL